RSVLVEGGMAMRVINWSLFEAPKGGHGDCKWAGSFRLLRKIPGRCWPKAFLLFEGRPQDGDDKMRKIRRAFIHLQPTHHAVFRQILRNARFRNSEVLCELRLGRIRSAPA